MNATEIRLHAESHSACQHRIDEFHRRLTAEYERLFVEDPSYAFAAKRTTPLSLATKMTLGLDNGTASNDGEGIRNVCKQLGIKNTYKAIRKYFAGE